MASASSRRGLLKWSCRTSEELSRSAPISASSASLFLYQASVGRSGVTRVLQPDLSAEERNGLKKSAENLRIALERIA